MVLHASAALESIVGFAPRTPFSRVIGEFMKRLPQKLGACIASMDDAGLSALLGDRRDAAEGRHILSTVESIAL